MVLDRTKREKARQKKKFSCEVALFSFPVRVSECGLFFASVIATDRSKF
jgi:hypothetical protein